MFNSRQKRNSSSAKNIYSAVAVALEPLESRQLLSGSPFGGFGGHHGHGGGGGFGGTSHGGSTIAFSLAPTAVQTGLDKIATADGLTDPTSTQLVRLNNVNGVETYSVTLTGTGTVSTLTVDQLGDAVTAPTYTTTTFGTLSGTGTGSDAAAAAEITAIATALGLTAPVATDTVDVSTPSTGAVTYSIHLTPSSTSTTTTDYHHDFGSLITVDTAGNPVGNQQLPFSVFSTAVQNGLNSHAPTGATALAATSTQTVDVATIDGVVTYSTTFTVTGTQTKVTVNSTGTLVSLPATTTTTFSALSTALQTELQTLATADGVTTTIAATQSINVLTETNGTVIYSAVLSATGTTSGGSTYNFDVTVSVDSSGNPTTLPHDGGFGFGHFGDHGYSFGDNDGAGTGSSTNSSSGTSTNSSSGTSTNASSSAISIPTNSGSTLSTTSAAPSAVVASANSLSSYSLIAKLLPHSINGLTMIGGYFAEFAPASISTAVVTDAISLVMTGKQLVTDTKALTAVQKKTLKADTKAQAAALKAMNSTLAPLEATLKTDAKSFAKTLKADAAAIHKDRKNAAALATDQAKLATDRAAALAAVVSDVTAIDSAVSTNAGVIAAQGKLAADLPTIANDEATLKADVSQLLIDL